MEAKVHYRIHNSQPFVPVLSKILKSTSYRIHFNLTLLRATPPKYSRTFTLPHQNPASIFLLPIRATRPAHLILLDLITRIIFGEQYKSCSSSLCSLLQPPVTPSFLIPNRVLSGETPHFFATFAVTQYDTIANTAEYSETMF